jgi:hypothetical protein
MDETAARVEARSSPAPLVSPSAPLWLRAWAMRRRMPEARRPAASRHRRAEPRVTWMPRRPSRLPAYGDAGPGARCSVARVSSSRPSRQRLLLPVRISRFLSPWSVAVAAYTARTALTRIWSPLQASTASASGAQPPNLAQLAARNSNAVR